MTPVFGYRLLVALVLTPVLTQVAWAEAQRGAQLFGEQDLTPDFQPCQPLRVSNTTLTVNSDGSCDVTTGGGGGSGDITDVGDCATGACGQSGTLTLTGALAVNGTSPSVSMTPTGGSAVGMHSELSGASSSLLYLKNGSTTPFLSAPNINYYGSSGNGNTTITRHQFDTASNPNSLVITAGQVGIGVSTPGAPLTISKEDNSTASTIRLINAKPGADAQTRIDFNNNTGVGNTAGGSLFYTSSDYGSGYNSAVGFWNYQNGPIIFATNNTEQVRLLGSGNLGLNTTNPSYKLHVVGSSGTVVFGGTGLIAGDTAFYASNSGTLAGDVNLFSDDLSTTGDVIGSFKNGSNSAGADAYMNVQVAGASAGDPFMHFVVSGVQGWSVGVHNGNNDAFTIAASDDVRTTPRVTILTGGNVGIGDTSPAASLTVGNGDLFQVSSTGAVTINTTVPQLNLTDTTGGDNDMELYLDGDVLTLQDTTVGGDAGIIGQFAAAGTSHTPSVNALRDKTAGFFCGGTMSTAMDCESARPSLSSNCTLQAVKITCLTAPAGQALILDLNECNPSGQNCTSVWSATQANRIQCAAGATVGVQTSFDNPVLNADNVLSMDVDQVGSTTAGSDVTVTLVCRS